jgi:hypothetical protein
MKFRMNLERIDPLIAKLNKYAVSGKANLSQKTRYYSQRDNYTMASRSCFSSSNAMFLTWLREATGKPALSGGDEYLRKVLSIGDTIDHNVQTAAIKTYGYSTKWNYFDEENAEDSEKDNHIDYIRDLLTAGFPVVTNISHRGDIDAPRGGHVIMLCGWLQSSREFLAQDPYGTLRSNYEDENGRLSTISANQYYARWQGGYRTLA